MHLTPSKCMPVNSIQNSVYPSENNSFVNFCFVLGGLVFFIFFIYLYIYIFFFFFFFFCGGGGGCIKGADRLHYS